MICAAYLKKKKSGFAEIKGGRYGGKEKRGREGRELEEGKREEVGWRWWVSFQALEVEKKEENGKIRCCFKKQKGERGRSSSSTPVVFFPFLFNLPSSQLHGLLIWDLFKSWTAAQEDFSLLG